MTGLARGSAALAVALVTVACGDDPGSGDGRGSGPAAPDPVMVAVAANFHPVQEVLARRFEEISGHRVVSSVGATGQLYAQIVSGAPFDVLLAADAERPRLLEEEGLAVPGSRFTYARGRLALFGPGLDSVRSGGADLRSGRLQRLAIANPRTAPYGAAAEEVLTSLGVAEALRDRIVRGESIGQTYQFVRSGGAELGLVALSQVIEEPERSFWRVPADLHGPILQDAVLLGRAAESPAARAYLSFLRGEEARRIIERFGYEPGRAATGEAGAAPDPLAPGARP